MKRNSISSLGGEAVKSSCCTIYIFVCAISNGSLLANQLRVNSRQQKQFEMVNNDNPLINVNLALSVSISDLLRITLPVDMDNKGTKIWVQNRISKSKAFSR